MLRTFFLVASLIFIFGVAAAQPGGGPPPDPMAPVPIPGIPLLIMLGALLGIRNLAKNKFKDNLK